MLDQNILSIFVKYFAFKVIQAIFKLNNGIYGLVFFHQIHSSKGCLILFENY